MSIVDFKNLSYEKPLLQNFISEIYVPYFNQNNIMRYNKSVKYDLITKQVKMQFTGYEEGNFEKFIDNIKKENIEFLGIYPTSDLLNKINKYYISCIFGNIENYQSSFSIENNDIITGQLELKFYDIKIIQQKEKFDNNRYLDQVHKLIYEKNIFDKL